jgi:hypothetical protein
VLTVLEPAPAAAPTRDDDDEDDEDGDAGPVPNFIHVTGSNSNRNREPQPLRDTPLSLRACHALSALYLHLHESQARKSGTSLSRLDQAYNFNRRALLGRRRLFGKDHEAYRDSLRMTIAICRSRGEIEVAEGHAASLGGGRDSRRGTGYVVDEVVVVSLDDAESNNASDEDTISISERDSDSDTIFVSGTWDSKDGRGWRYNDDDQETVVQGLGGGAPRRSGLSRRGQRVRSGMKNIEIKKAAKVKEIFGKEKDRVIVEERPTRSSDYWTKAPATPPPAYHWRAGSAEKLLRRNARNAYA